MSLPRNQYTVEMVSRMADWEAAVTVSADSWQEAKEGAPSLMAAPQMWLVTKVTTHCGDVTCYDGGSYHAL